MSDDPKVQGLDELVQKLANQAHSACRDLGFLEAALESTELSNKILDSFGGHAIDTAIRAVAHNLVLFSSRCWNKKEGILRAANIAIPLAPYIEAERRRRRPDWSAHFLEIGDVGAQIDAVIVDGECYTESDVAHKIRVYRDEKVAHIIQGRGRHRLKLEDMGREIGDLTYSELLESCRFTLKQIRELNRIWNFQLVDFEDVTRIHKRYTEELWSALPVLKDVERQSLA